VAVTGYFVMYGVVLAVWVTRIPAIKQQAGLSDGLLGAALLAIPAGVFAVTLLAGRLADRVGSATVTGAGGIAMPLALVLPALAGGLWPLVAALAVFGVAAGALNIGMNANGVLVERARGRPVMTSFHAGYSLGALAGSVAGGLAAHGGAGPLPTFAVTALPCAVFAVAGRAWLLREPGRPGGQAAHSSGTGPAPDPSRAQPGAPSPSPAGEPPAGRRGGVLSAWAASLAAGRPGALIGLLGMIGFGTLLAEGAAADWSAVYLRDNLGTSAGLAAAGFAAFSVAMAAGRLCGDRLVARFGPVRTVRASALLAAAGLAAGLLSGSPAGAIAGFALLGAGLACIAPQVFLAGGQADPARPGHGLARVVGLSYVGMVGGPPLIGGIASVAGLPLALGIPAVLAVGVAALAWVVAVPAAGLPAGGHGSCRT
jgi:MFS family permease